MTLKNAAMETVETDSTELAQIDTAGINMELSPLSGILP